MVKKPLHKSYTKFRNGHSYLEWCILGFKEYLHTLVFRWRHWRLTATPSGNVYIRRTGILEYQNGPNHSHSMHLRPVVWAPRSLVTTDLSRQGQRTPQGGRPIGSWQLVTVLRTEAGLPHCLFPQDPPHLLLPCPNLWVVIGPERHSSPDVEGSSKEWAIYMYMYQGSKVFCILFMC